MTDVPTSPLVYRDVDIRAGGGHTASGAADGLALAAAPVFALMALWTGFSGDRPDLLCMPMQDASPLGGMAVMYLLMSVFHLGPWLKLISRRRSGAQ